MASSQLTAVEEQPSSLSRYRSTRQAAQIAAQVAASPSSSPSARSGLLKHQDGDPTVQRSMSRYHRPQASAAAKALPVRSASTSQVSRPSPALRTGTLRDTKRPIREKPQSNVVAYGGSSASPSSSNAESQSLSKTSSQPSTLVKRLSKDLINATDSPKSEGGQSFETDPDQERRMRVQAHMQQEQECKDLQAQVEAQKISQRQKALDARQEQINALARAEYAELQRRTKHRAKMEAYRDEQLNALALQPDTLQWEQRQKEQQGKIEKDMEKRREKREKERRAREKNKPAGGFNRDRDPLEVQKTNSDDPIKSVEESKITRSDTEQSTELRKSSSKEIFGFLKKKKSGLKSPPPELIAEEEEPPRPQRDFSVYPTLDPKINPVEPKKPPSKPAVNPARATVDAPKSAINTGNRFVCLERGTIIVSLPVTPTTTPVDLLRAASTFSKPPIDVHTHVLLESFGKVGIHRPLRKYERVWDILNSWDFDRQNSLIVMPSANDGFDIDLQADYVPIEQPPESTYSLQHSQRPSKWDKRFITIRPDGQVVLSKNETTNPKDKDLTNICHISDFDIYSPNPSTAAGKRIKPPKKFCFAVKSQQKSSMFESTENFVHFFCTGDQKTAAGFYSAVQGWRSWYLVNVLGLGGGNDPSGRRQQRPGSKDSQYQLGSFKPLLDLDTISPPANAPTITSLSSQIDPNRAHIRKHSSSASESVTKHHPSASTSRHSGAPSPAFPKQLSSSIPTQPQPQQSNTPSSKSSSIMNRGRVISRTTANPLSHGSDHNNNDATAALTFAPTGLLGTSYSSKQNPSAHPAKASRTSQQGPFITGPSLLNSISEPKSTSGTGSPQRASLPRPSSKRDEAAGIRRKPLLDTTTSDALGGGTFFDDSDNDPLSPFGRQGLISQLPPSPTKRHTKSREGPMLDVAPRSKFERGSLLEKVERERGGEGAGAPVLDRSRGREVVVGTGER